MSIIQELREPLDIKDVEFRVQSISKKGFATILAYKDARVDMNRLDDVCGELWQDKYELIDGQLFCSIGIKIGEEWVWRQDVGVESYTEKEKGRASDAFKRAGFRWGIGRELYDYPFINLMLFPDEFTVQDGKARQTYNLNLRKWKWEWIDDVLIAVDEKNRIRFDSSKEFNGLPSAGETRSLYDTIKAGLTKLNSEEQRARSIQAIEKSKLSKTEKNELIKLYSEAKI